MSDTTGWEKFHDTCYEKRIDGRTFVCVKWRDSWFLKICCGSVELAKRDSLEECQILAHATARLWAGENE